MFFQHTNYTKRDDGGTYRLKDETYQANAMCLSYLKPDLNKPTVKAF